MQYMNQQRTHRTLYVRKLFHPSCFCIPDQTKLIQSGLLKCQRISILLLDNCARISHTRPEQIHLDLFTVHLHGLTTLTTLSSAHCSVSTPSSLTYYHKWNCLGQKVKQRRKPIFDLKFLYTDNQRV